MFPDTLSENELSVQIQKKKKDKWTQQPRKAAVPKQQ